jgi:DNA ligase-1
LRPFAELLDRLSLTTSRNAKLILLRDYLKATSDPDRGWALAALTGDLSFATAKPAMIRKAVEARVDPVLFGWSYDYVGDSGGDDGADLAARSDAPRQSRAGAGRGGGRPYAG